MLSNLLNEVTLESDVLAHFVRKCHGDDVSQSLDFVDDGICEVQVLPVLNLHLTTSFNLA